MNWWQHPWYNGPPPYGPNNHYGQPPQYVPIPQGMDPLKVAEFFDRVQRRAERKREKEEAKKKDKKPEGFSAKDALWYFQAATVLWFLSPFMGAIQHAITLILR